jgi:predicted nucleic-acid-binding protein
MAGLDTNVLVRWLVDDDAGQSQRIKALFESALRQGRSLFVPLTVTLELEWVLRSRYKFIKPDILLAMNALLETRELEFQAEPAIERALHAYRQGNADFADCLHAGSCWMEGETPMLTLDAKAARLTDAALLPT